MQPEQTHPRPRGFRRRLLGDIFHGVKRYLILGVAATLCATFLTYVTPLVVSFTVDSVIGDKTPELPAALSALFQRMGGRAYFSSHIWVLASLVVLVTLLGGVFTYLRGHCIAFAGEGLAKRLRDRLFTHLEAVPYSYHVGVQTGDLVQRCTSDVETVRRFVQMQAMEVVRTVVMVCTAISIMLPISGAMTAVSTCLLPILVVFSFFYFRGVQRQFTRSDEAEGALSTTLQENLTGVRVVRAFAQESSELDKFTRRNKAYHDITLHLTTLMGAYWGLSDMIGYLQIALSGVCGVYFAVHGGFSLGNVLLFTTYTSMLTFPMRQLGRILADLGKADISLSRLEDILAVPAEAEPGKALTPQIDGSVAFEDVCFDYGDGVPVLSHVSFTVRPGQTIGILGSTGAGKSSLVQLLQRLYPVTAGRITLSGVDVNDIERHHLRRNVGIVLQEPFLYSRTIGENIAIARPDADLSDVYAAARTASVHDVIESFSEGYDTVVGERGVTLSGGEVLAQAAFALDLMAACKRYGIHLALELLVAHLVQNGGVPALVHGERLAAMGALDLVAHETVPSCCSRKSYTVADAAARGSAGRVQQFQRLDGRKGDAPTHDPQIAEGDIDLAHGPFGLAIAAALVVAAAHHVPAVEVRDEIIQCPGLVVGKRPARFGNRLLCVDEIVVAAQRREGHELAGAIGMRPSDARRHRRIQGRLGPGSGLRTARARVADLLPPKSREHIHFPSHGALPPWCSARDQARVPSGSCP